MTKTALRIALVTSLALLAPAASALAAPTATVGASWTNPPTRPSVGQTVTFTANVTDWDGVAGTVNWDFGDGTTGAGLTVTHTYASTGAKFITAVATNGDVPAESSAPMLLGVTVNAVPIADFSWLPATGTTGVDVRFGSESDDPDGTIAEYDWNFGDGVTDSRRNPSHPFDSAGTKTVTLTVTDAFGASDSISHQVVIVDPQPPAGPVNDPPRANFAFSPRSPQVGDAVEFVSSSVDPEGNLRSQTWDLDGDGQFDDGRGDVVVYTFSSSGPKTVRLRVEDQGDKADVHERTLTIQPRPVAGPGALNPSPLIVLNGQILGNGARIRVLRVRAPRKALVTVRCVGKGCPVKQRRKRVKRAPLRFKTYERFLRAGVKLQIYVRKPNTIGSYTRYVIRKGKAPARIDRCLRPGKKKPTHC